MSKTKSKTQTAPKPNPRIPKNSPLIILFGLDEQEQPRGAYFKGEDEALLTRMAKGLGLRIGIAIAPHHVAIVNKLPKGDAHATGQKAVPKIALDLYEKLNALVGGETGVISPAQPKTWDEIAPGHLVIAPDNLSDGWWPAVVVKRHEQKLVLKWRDFPNGDVIKDVNSVALLKTE
jgi:hypothetical protein